MAQVYIGSDTTTFLAKLLAVAVAIHIIAAVVYPPFYAYLIQQEYMVLTNFVNAVGQALRNLFGSFLGFW